MKALHLLLAIAFLVHPFSSGTAAEMRVLGGGNLPPTVTPPTSDAPPEYWGCRRDVTVHVAPRDADSKPWDMWSSGPDIAMCIVGSLSPGRYCTPGLNNGKALCENAYNCRWENVAFPNLTMPLTVEIIDMDTRHHELIDQGECDVGTGRCVMNNSVVEFTIPHGQVYTEESVEASILSRHVGIQAGQFTGSGVLVDGRTVMTAAHVLEDHEATISVIIAPDTAHERVLPAASVVIPFIDVDLATITLDPPLEGVPALRMVNDPNFHQNRQSGASALKFIGVAPAVGYLADGPRHVACSNPELVSFRMAELKDGKRPILSLPHRSDWVSRPGMSGSGVYTANGELIGVHAGGNRRGERMPDGAISGGYNHHMELSPNPVLAAKLGAVPFRSVQ